MKYRILAALTGTLACCVMGAGAAQSSRVAPGRIAHFATLNRYHVGMILPHVLVGGASGKLKGDRHLAYASRTMDQFGNSNGRLPGI